MDLEQSFAEAERISRSSGSSFYRSFQFLRADRRRAMHALYAFARIADDATDNLSTSNDWDRESWLEWIQKLQDPEIPKDSISDPRLPKDLQAIRLAIADSVGRYRIPLAMLDSLVEGMDMDARGVEISDWEDFRQYAFRVASSVGICCTAIWTDGNPISPDQPLWRSSVDCGVAFQLTNILRDVKEDAGRGRVYLPLEDLERFGISRSQWLDSLNANEPAKPLSPDSLSKLVAVQIERARGLFASGWQLQRMLDPDSYRMFSLMWHTYRCILSRIEKDPTKIFTQRVRLGARRKMMLATQHCFTPLLVRIGSNTERETDWVKQVVAPKCVDRKPSVAVVGGGLAGMNAAFHLARHGCEVVLYEAKSRLGGRAGSFLDPSTNQAIDYCQHVGMKCCTELRRWMDWTSTSDAWRAVDTLHFVSNSGRKLSLRAWPLPAPLHLSGLILGWPDLSLTDRIRVAAGLSQLMVAKSTPAFEQMPALPWLNAHFQNQRTIDRFWATILVSALGEQVDRVAMGPVKKVLVDGFAATRDAFHLLVPTQPLYKVMDQAPRAALRAMQVDVRCSEPVHAIHPDVVGGWRVHAAENRSFDSVVVAVPWYRVGAILRDAELSSESKTNIDSLARIEASPITGVHTWWDRPWLKQPHAIVIDRLSQWVFPGPDQGNAARDATDSTGEIYYQVVISGSRQLPRGDHDAILQAVQRDLQDLFPDAAVAKMLRGKVVTDPQSVFSVSPGHQASRLSNAAMAKEGIFLSGDWIDTGWPATMEGALRSGCLAAQSALAYLGRPAKWFD